MPDHAVSSHPGVQQQLDRLAALSPGADVLGLERIRALLARLGHPELLLPPVFHVAGTNGKGSTCAFLRAGLEAAGLKTHVYTSPHLVRFNERIRLAGELIADDMLAALLDEVLGIAGDIGASFFEVTTAAAFLAFSRVPADACVIEVGLGGRLDATNVVPAPIACGITQLGLDHQSFLGDRIETIAAEKAGIAKSGALLITQHYTDRIASQIEAAAAAAGARWLPRGEQWDASTHDQALHYRDAWGRLELPLPRLPGVHQATNAGLAIAMLRHQRLLSINDASIRAAIGWAEWPARLQRLGEGALLDLLPNGAELWLDGGHNPAAARVVADFFRGHVPADRPFHMLFGLLENKDPVGTLKPFRNRSVTLHAIPVRRHAHHAPDRLVTVAKEAGIVGMAHPGLEEGLGWIARHADRTKPPIVLIFGSLYVAGEVLEKNGQAPD